LEKTGGFAGRNVPAALRGCGMLPAAKNSLRGRRQSCGLQRLFLPDERPVGGGSPADCHCYDRPFCPLYPPAQPLRGRRRPGFLPDIPLEIA